MQKNSAHLYLAIQEVGLFNSIQQILLLANHVQDTEKSEAGEDTPDPHTLSSV